MSAIRMILLAIIAVLLLITPDTVLGEVTVNPHGFGLSVEEGGEAEAELVLSNHGEEDVAFGVRYQLIDYQLVEDEERMRGPRRDNPGEILQEYNVPYYNTVGMAWDPDNSWVWALAWSDHRIWAFDPENDRVVVNMALNASVLGLFYRDGLLYAGGYNNNPNVVFRYNTQGQLIDNLRIPRNLTWTTISGDDRYLYTLAYPTAGGHGDVHVFDLDNNLEEVATIDCNEWIGDDGYGIEVVHAHRQNWLWLADRERLYQFRVDEEWNPELVQLFETVESGHCGLAHDGVNLWRGTYDGETRIWYVIDDGVPEQLDITINPESGILSADESIDVSIIVAPDDCDAGIYNGVIRTRIIEPEEGQELALVEVSMLLSIGTPVADVTGVVISQALNQPMEGVRVHLDGYPLDRFTDEDGAFGMDGLPRGEYNLIFTSPDYLPHIEHIDIREAEELEVEVALLHSECNLDREDVITELAPDDQTVIPFNVSNDGTGTLTYITERRLFGDANADPWVLRESFNVSAEVDDSRLEGAVFANDRCYGGGNNDNEPAIYILDREGNLINQFAQPDQDNRLRDMAFDGEYIWGGASRTVYGMSLAGEVAASFESHANPTAAVAWDPDHALLWVTGTTTNIQAYDREGNAVGDQISRSGLRIYGLAYWQDDPDDCPLYIFNNPGNNRQLVHKMNPADGDTVFVRELFPDGGGSPGGAFITNQYDIYSWVMMGVSNAGADDRIDVWQLEGRKNWMMLDPEEGMIDAGAGQRFELTLDAIGLPVAEYRGEIVFLHDGRGRETHLPITLTVAEGHVRAQRTIDLALGWNMVSVNLQPDEEDVTVLTVDLVEANLLELMKDGSGHFYRPDFHYNDIPGWFVEQGYLMKVREETELTLEGITALWNDPIELHEGWQIVSYYPRTPVDAKIALSGIVDNLLIAKDCFGHFYVPAWDFSDIGDMREGQGYLVKLDADAELIYRIEEEEGLASSPASSRELPEWLPMHPVTGFNMSLLVTADTDIKAEIGVYAGDRLVGSGVLHDGVCGIAVWGDDPTTSTVDGALVGDVLELRIHDSSGERPVEFETLEGNGRYATDDLWVVRLDAVSTPVEFGLTAVYPNPFNESIQIEFALPTESFVNLTVYGVDGRLVDNIVNDCLEAGIHRTHWRGSGLPAGLYLLKMDSGGQIKTRKLVLVK